MSRSSGDRAAPLVRRGQASPIAALVATFAVIVGVGLYAGVVADLDRNGDDRTAETTAETLQRTAAGGDVVDSEELRAAATDPAVTPAGFESNATLALGGSGDGNRNGGWSVGPTPPDGASGTDRGSEKRDGVDVQRADRTVAVRIAPGEIRRGTLRVRVWR